MPRLRRHTRVTLALKARVAQGDSASAPVRNTDGPFADGPRATQWRFMLIRPSSQNSTPPGRGFNAFPPGLRRTSLLSQKFHEIAFPLSGRSEARWSRGGVASFRCGTASRFRRERYRVARVAEGKGDHNMTDDTTAEGSATNE